MNAQERFNVGVSSFRNIRRLLRYCQNAFLQFPDFLRMKYRQRQITRLRIAEQALLERDRSERENIARVFNMRYCTAERYDRSSNKYVPNDWDSKPGVFGFSRDLKEGYRWMCPNCNVIHSPLRNTLTKGLIYPKCCTFREDARHLDYPDVGILKRPIGWCGHDGLYLKMLRADVEPSSDNEQWSFVSNGPKS